MIDSSTVVTLFRAGHVAKGVVYGLVGLLALGAAAGLGGRATGGEGALQTLADGPLGQFLLALIALGLLGYVVWRLAEAIWDADHVGSDPKGIAKRVGYLGSAAVYAALCATAARLALGTGGQGGNQQQELSAWLLSKPFGQVMLALVGIAVIVVGLSEFYRVYTKSYLKNYNHARLTPEEARRVKTVSELGLVAHGVVLSMIGGFVLTAALNADPRQAGGLGESLQTLASQPFGPWLLGALAIGLLCYGAYCLFLASFKAFPQVPLHAPS
jgi:hypothetical protein